MPRNYVSLFGSGGDYLPSVGGGPGFTPVGSASAAAGEGAATTIAVARTGIGAGNLLMAYVSSNVNNGTATCTDGTTPFTAGTSVFTDLGSRFFWLLSANGGDKTITVTLGASSSFRRLIVREFSFTGTISLDQQNGVTFTAAGTVSSGNISAAAITVCFGGFCNALIDTASSAEQINSQNADAVTRIGANNDVSMWYRIVSGTFTGPATCSTASTDGNIQVVSIKAV